MRAAAANALAEAYKCVVLSAADASSKLASADASSILEAHRRVAQKAGGLLSNFMSPTKSRESANE